MLHFKVFFLWLLGLRRLEWTRLTWLLRWAGSEHTRPQVGHLTLVPSSSEEDLGGEMEGEGEGETEEVDGCCMTGTI